MSGSYQYCHPRRLLFRRCILFLRCGSDGCFSIVTDRCFHVSRRSSSCHIQCLKIHSQYTLSILLWIALRNPSRCVSLQTLIQSFPLSLRLYCSLHGDEVSGRKLTVMVSCQPFSISPVAPGETYKTSNCS